MNTQIETMATHLLSPSTERPRPALALHPEVALAMARVHEACGAARSK
ncbi:hypothetical protein QO034_12220 [Sedimentitalea sp. JM2-8]|uniref:Uncharacterized protein n=1 Tax=Sedimentitalea xiamensis TaxID=3050037 RepID=A0ABT7FFH3_9RHOB|nr:hypothetical protein [Sedimentitalea xiamensis]MDK3073879.1 hypothetical protein [Sedimentitalea xiamensis]